MKPKQETLEEAAEKWYDSTEENKGFPKIKAFKDGAKWQMDKQDEFAIGFAEFSINYNYHPMHKVWIRYDKMSNEKFTTKELLEIYKKENYGNNI